jgi:hypothetical protein
LRISFPLHFRTPADRGSISRSLNRLDQTVRPRDERRMQIHGVILKDSKTSVNFWIKDDEARFMNVDLDVFSRRSLVPLADALGEKVSQMYVGREGRHYGAHFELAYSYGKDADRLIVALVRLVKGLPPIGRQAWAHAYRRDFNIGIQGGLRPRSLELAVKPETLNLIRAVNARLVITVYAADQPSSSAVKTRPSREGLTQHPQRTQSARLAGGRGRRRT